MSFTAETLERTELRGEPDWLRERRRAALADYERLPMPSRTDEEWRRTDLGGLDTARFEHANGAAPAPKLPAGVIYESLATAAAKHPELVEPVLFTLLHHDRDR